MKKIHSLILLIACFVTTACGSSSSGQDELKRLCEKDAGLIINKAVEADGYYDASRKSGTLGLLVPSGYRFSEFCNFEPNAMDLFAEPGCWRLTKVSRDARQCNKTIDKILWRYARKGYVEFREKNCIAVEKIEKPEARYRYEVERKEWWHDEIAQTKMVQYVGRIVNSKTGEMHGEGKNYVLRPKRSNPPSFHCGSAHVTGLQKSRPFAAGLIEKTLVPRKYDNKGELK